jgi:hypothetical protein
MSKLVLSAVSAAAGLLALTLAGSAAAATIEVSLVNDNSVCANNGTAS